MAPNGRFIQFTYGPTNPDGTRRWMELERVSRPEGPIAPAQTMRNRLTFSLLEKIRLPTLLITGGADLYTPPPLLRLFAARIRNSESVIVPEAGHSTYWENPELFNQTILEFIGKH